MAQTQSRARDRPPHLRTKQTPGTQGSRQARAPALLPAITRKAGAVFRPQARAGNAPWSPQPSMRRGYTEAPKVSVHSAQGRLSVPDPERPPLCVCHHPDGVAGFRARRPWTPRTAAARRRARDRRFRGGRETKACRPPGRTRAGRAARSPGLAGSPRCPGRGERALRPQANFPLSARVPPGEERRRASQPADPRGSPPNRAARSGAARGPPGPVKDGMTPAGRSGGGCGDRTRPVSGP